MLVEIAILLFAAVIAVPLTGRMGLGTVLGYLIAGVAIGPWCLRLITDVDTILTVSQLGVVMLLFVMGLELQPSRLWRLRRNVFGLGGAQMLVSVALLGAVIWWLGFTPLAAFVAAAGLATSCTAYALQTLAERHELTARHGRSAFSILLFQDLAVVPLLALLPALAAHTADSELSLTHVLAPVLVVAILLGGGRVLIRPVLRAVATSGAAEIFTAAALLTVIGSALLLQVSGLSMAMGAFLAGVMLADSEYRHQLQADIEPFKGLLMGLFFMGIGMSVNLGLLAQAPLLAIGLVLALMLLKAVVLYGIGRMAGIGHNASRSLAALLPQGGEFAFVLFAMAAGLGLMSAQQESWLILVASLSILLSPLLYLLNQRLRRAEPTVQPYDEIVVPETEVIIAGFGTFGQIIGRILRLRKVSFTVLEKDVANVDFVRRFGNPVFYSDAGRLQVLRAAHADKAKLIVIAVAEPEDSVRIAETVRRHYPALRVLAVARTRQHAMRLLDLGVHEVIRRSYFSSLEMSRSVLEHLGVPEAVRSVQTFREHDEALLLRQQALQHDVEALVQSAQESARDLEQLFEADAEERKES
jgi:monovalent cation:proton antiporter-2 (CPA2) family protein